MTEIERGIKRRCSSCDAPFYDMLRYPIRCPKCGTEFDATAGKKLASVPRALKTSKARIGRPAAAKAAPTAPELEQPPEPKEEEEVEVEDEDLVDGEDLDEDDEEDDDGDEDAAKEDDGDDNVTGDH